MKGDLRKQALANWQKLFSMPANLISDEARYDKLLRAADDMERSGLIRSDEWRKLVGPESRGIACEHRRVHGRR
jgi:hypothetical protein